MCECEETFTCGSRLISWPILMHFYVLANQKLVTEPTVTWAGLFTGHTKFSEVGRWSVGRERKKNGRLVCNDFKRVKFVLNVHTDVTDRGEMSLTRCYCCCCCCWIRSICLLLHSVSLNNYWGPIPSRSVNSKSFHVLLHSAPALHGKTALHAQPKEIITPRRLAAGGDTRQGQLPFMSIRQDVLSKCSLIYKAMWIMRRWQVAG